MAKLVAICLVAMFAYASAFPLLPSMRLSALPDNWKDFFGGMPEEWKEYVDKVIKAIPDEWVPIIDKIIATGEATDEEKAAYEKFWTQFPETWKDHFEAYAAVYFGLDDDEEEPAERQGEPQLSEPVAHFFQSVEEAVGKVVVKYSAELEKLQEKIQPHVEQLIGGLIAIGQQYEAWVAELGPKAELLQTDIEAEFAPLKQMAELATPEQVTEAKIYIAEYAMAVLSGEEQVNLPDLTDPVLKFFEAFDKAFNNIFEKHAAEFELLQQKLEPIFEQMSGKIPAIAKEIESWGAELGPKALEMQKDIEVEVKALVEMAKNATPEQVEEAKMYVIQAIAANL